MDTEKRTAQNGAEENTEQKENPIEKKPKEPEKLFPARLSKFESFYLLVVIVSCAGLAAAIAVAVMRDLLWGAVIAAVAIFVYVYFTSNELHEKLGIWYRTDAGSLSVTRCHARYGDLFYIPSRLLWYDVEEICEGAFLAPKGKNAELRAIYLPKTLKKIGKDAFSSCDALATIYFEGTREEWETVECLADIEALEIIYSAEIPKKKK